MKMIFLTLLLTGYTSQILYATGENPTIGARAIGIGKAAATFKDPFAIFNNVAGISEINSLTAFTSYHLPYSMVQVRQVAAGIIIPFKEFKAGISVFDFGNRDFNQTCIGLGLAHKIKHVSLGIKVNYYQTSIREVNTIQRVVLEFGGITEFSKHIHVGAHVYNMNQASIGDNPNAIPITMKLGISIIPTTYLRATIETEKTGTYQPFLKAGLEYLLAKTISIRTGITTFDFTTYYGVGWKNTSLTFDYAISSHPYLGISHTLSFIYLFKKKK